MSPSDGRSFFGGFGMAGSGPVVDPPPRGFVVGRRNCPLTRGTDIGHRAAIGAPAQPASLGLSFTYRGLRRTANLRCAPNAIHTHTNWIFTGPRCARVVPPRRGVKGAARQATVSWLTVGGAAAGPVVLTAYAGGVVLAAVSWPADSSW